MSQDVFAAILAALERGEESALVTIVSTRGSTPQRPGARMLVFADGRTVGTIGGGCCEDEASWKARETIRTGRTEVAHFDLTDDLAGESGLICGGRMDVFIEPIRPVSRLYVVGAGHIGYHVARFGHAIGFKVHVVDDREKFANRERFPYAEEVVVDSISGWLERTELKRPAYAVVVTRGHKYDLEAARALISRDLRYLGMIGSRSKVRQILEALAAESVPRELLERLYAPIGLDLGAVTPEEIALSIVAELVGVRSGRIAGPRTTPEPLKRPAVSYD
jgi:xanthine dehydrogenase accessory factor